MSTTITLATGDASQHREGLTSYECYPPAGTTQATFKINVPDVPPNDIITDPGAFCRLSADAEYANSPRQGYVHLPAVAGDGLWQGGSNQTAPSITVQWDANNPATKLCLRFFNGPNGVGNSFLWNSITVTFS